MNKAKRSLTVKPIQIKGGMRSDGVLVKPYTAQRKVALDKDVKKLRGKGQGTKEEVQNQAKEQPSAPTSPDVFSSFHPTDKVTALGMENHSSGVYVVERENGSTWYYKPAKEARWKDSEGTPYRYGLKDNRLHERGLAVHDVATQLGTDVILKTEHIEHPEHGPGSIQRSAIQTAKENGWETAEPLSNIQVVPGKYRGTMPNQFFGRSRAASSFDAPSTRSALQNGGMDLATMDFITLNMDRRSANIFLARKNVGKDNEQFGMYGIDNDLAFPDTARIDIFDAMNTGETIWAMAMTDGKDISISSKFKEGIQKTASQDLHKTLRKRQLTEPEIDGAVARFAAVKQVMEKNGGSFTGTDLKSCVDTFIEIDDTAKEFFSTSDESTTALWGTPRQKTTPSAINSGQAPRLTPTPKLKASDVLV